MSIPFKPFALIVTSFLHYGVIMKSFFLFSVVLRRQDLIYQ